jgi:hypothetical protein
MERELSWRAHARIVAEIMDAGVRGEIPLPTEGGRMLVMWSGRLSPRLVETLGSMLAFVALMDQPEPAPPPAPPAEAEVLELGA